MSTAAVRKLLQCFGFVFAAGFAVGNGFVTCDMRAAAVVFLTAGYAFAAFGRGGYLANHVDLAPRYSGVLFGITNTIANFSGVLAPLSVGYLTPTGTRAEWQTVFYIMAAVYLFGAIVFGTFAKGEKQEWARDDDVIMETKVGEEEGAGSKLV